MSLRDRVVCFRVGSHVCKRKGVPFMSLRGRGLISGEGRTVPGGSAGRPCVTRESRPPCKSVATPLIAAPLGSSDAGRRAGRNGGREA